MLWMFVRDVCSFTTLLIVQHWLPIADQPRDFRWFDSPWLVGGPFTPIRLVAADEFESAVIHHAPCAESRVDNVPMLIDAIVQEWSHRPAVSVPSVNTGIVKNGRVQVQSRYRDIARIGVNDAGTGDDEGNTNGGVERRVLLPLAVVAEHLTVIAHEDYQRLIKVTVFFNGVNEFTETTIEVFNHPGVISADGLMSLQVNRAVSFGWLWKVDRRVAIQFVNSLGDVPWIMRILEIDLEKPWFVFRPTVEESSTIPGNPLVVVGLIWKRRRFRGD